MEALIVYLSKMSKYITFDYRINNMRLAIKK